MVKVPRVANDAVLLFMQELTARIVAETGRPEDRFHLGKIILQSIKDAPDFIMQVDGLTGETVTFGQALERTVRCAKAFRNMGLKAGDVMILMAPNYSDLAIVFYAALYEGIIIAPVDPSYGVLETKNAFQVNKPKIIFTQSNKTDEIETALKEIDMEIPMFTFDKGDKYLSFKDFVNKYTDDSPIEDYRAQDLDPDAIAMLVATSGTTGLPKCAACSHKNLVIVQPYFWARFLTFPTPTRMNLLCTTLQWMTALMNYMMSPVMRFTRLQCTEPLTEEVAYKLINNYRPTVTVLSPTLMTVLLAGQREKCDFSSFEVILLAGSAVHKELLARVEEVMPDVQASSCYGMTELSGASFHSIYPYRGAVGLPMACFQYKIVDVNTLEDIHEPNVAGELWVKGPGIIKQYYNNIEATKNTFSDDGWFKTGDTFYRDEHYYYYFVERIKLLLKYKNYQISPSEMEGVIVKHPKVTDVVVVGIPDATCGELPLAFIVKRADSDVTAQEIKDYVKTTMSDAKQLRGGVVFLEKFPTTVTSKADRVLLKKLAPTMKIE